MRIIYFGTPEFALKILKGIEGQKDIEIAAIVSSPDKPSGRGKKITSPPVAIYARQAGYPLLQPENLSDEEFLSTLQSFKADLFVVVAYRKLPNKVWQMPPMGTINFHPSYLPDYRGAAPINWAIINGETQTGITIFFINENIDSGDIILQETIAINFDDTADTLSEKIIKRGVPLLIKAIKQIENNNITPIPQHQLGNNLHKAPKITKQHRKIDWSKKSIEIYNLIRGLSKKPTAWTLLNKDGNILTVKIYFSIAEKIEHSYEPGEIIIEKKRLKIATSDGFIIPTEIQLEGKKILNNQQFLAGFRFKKAKFL